MADWSYEDMRKFYSRVKKDREIIRICLEKDKVTPDRKQEDEKDDRERES